MEDFKTLAWLINEALSVKYSYRFVVLISCYLSHIEKFAIFETDIWHELPPLEVTSNFFHSIKALIHKAEVVCFATVSQSTVHRLLLSENSSLY